MKLLSMIELYRTDCVYRQLSKGSIENYIKHDTYLAKYLEETFGVTELEEVTMPQIKSYVQLKQQAGRKPSYINDMIKAYKTFFRYCVEEEYLEKDPTKKLKNVKQPKIIIRTFTEVEVLKMINYCNGKDFVSIRDKIMLALLFDTGMRLNELVSLREDQIHEDYIIVWGKGSKERVVPLSPYNARLLMKYRIAKDYYFEGRNTKPKALVFVSYRGNKLNANSITKCMKNVAKAVGVHPDVRVSPHTCRHTFAQLQLKNGLDIYTLSRLLGHENITITQRYLQGIRNDEVLEMAKKTGVLQHL